MSSSCIFRWYYYRGHALTPVRAQVVSRFEKGGFMQERAFIRYDARLLLEDLTRVVLVLPDKREIESQIEDISSQGIRVSVPPQSATLQVPQPNETVGIIFKSIQLQITCRCIYSLNDQDGSMLMGFYVFDSDEQSKMRKILDRID